MDIFFFFFKQKTAYEMRISDWSSDVCSSDLVLPRSPIDWAEPSNEARYLNGIIGMAGDLDQATSFLLHPFMQRVFADLGGAAGLPDGKVQPTISRLEKAGRNRPSFDLKEPTDRAALGNFIVKAEIGRAH